MPVHMEWIESPTEQDWLDLNKLYGDVPLHWFAVDNEHTAQAYVAQKQSLGYQIAAGRFNDRLIAAALLRPKADKPNVYVIEDMCVRAITRERGVAKQMLVRICQWADQQKCSLWVEDENAKLRVLMEYGFVHGQGKWYRQG